MPYVQRDSDSLITAVSLEQQAGFAELLADDHPELRQFLNTAGDLNGLAHTDLDFVRVLEDLLDVLMAKNVLLFTELPESAQAKVLARQAMRRDENVLNLLDDEPRI